MADWSLAAHVGKDFVGFALEKLGGVQQAVLAQELGVDQRLISSLVRGRLGVRIERVLDLIGRWNAAHPSDPYLVVLSGLPEGVNARPRLAAAANVAQAVLADADVREEVVLLLLKLAHRKGLALDPDLLPVLSAVLSAAQR